MTGHTITSLPAYFWKFEKFHSIQLAIVNTSKICKKYFLTPPKKPIVLHVVAISFCFI